MTPFARLRRLAPGLAAAAALLLVAGCGGGISIGYSDRDGDGDGDGDNAPSVALSVSTSSAAPGAALRLTADARDDRAVAGVEFYRLDADGRSVLLGTDGGAPFDWNTLLPATALRGSTVYFYARAFDGRGQSANSATVGVAVQ